MDIFGGIKHASGFKYYFGYNYIVSLCIMKDKNVDASIVIIEEGKVAPEGGVTRAGIIQELTMKN